MWGDSVVASCSRVHERLSCLGERFVEREIRELREQNSHV